MEQTCIFFKRNRSTVKKLQASCRRCNCNTVLPRLQASLSLLRRGRHSSLLCVVNAAYDIQPLRVCMIYEPFRVERFVLQKAAFRLLFAWRRVRDSNPRYFRTQHFECCTFDHSDNSPCIQMLKRNGQNFKRFLLGKTLGKKNRQERNNQPNPNAPQAIENQRFFPDVPIKSFRAFESGPL